LADAGITQQYTLTHLQSSEHSSSKFLPWHREFVYLLENSIRGLGGRFTCFTLPYWDWSREPLPTDVKSGSELFIFNSGLGDDSDGECVSEEPWNSANYNPSGDADCLRRDADYASYSSRDSCTFWSSSQMMEVVDYSNEYEVFRPYLEGSPHALPHVCLGGDDGAQMSTFSSPDDPIFYLHHTYIDFLWALWQDCNDYDGATVSGYTDLYDSSTYQYLSFEPLAGGVRYTDQKQVRDTFDIIADYDVSYSKGAFWQNAGVDAADNCNAGINDLWFYDETTTLTSDVKMAAYDTSSLQSQCSALTGTPTEIGIACCELIQVAELGEVCSVPEGGLPDLSVDAVTGEKFSVNVLTGDIEISLAQMTAVEYNLPACSLAVRRATFLWAGLNDQLVDLQMGCFDPYCDLHAVSESGYQCFFSHQDDDEIEIEALEELEKIEAEVYSSAEMAAMDAAKQAKYAENQAADEGEIDVEELEALEAEVYSSAEMAAMDAAKQAKYAENQELDDGEIDVEALEKIEAEVYSSAELAELDAAKQAKYAENQAADEGEIDVEELEKFEEDEGEIRFMFNGDGVSEHVQNGAKSGLNLPLTFGVLGVIVLLLLICSRMNTDKKGELLLSAAQTSEMYGTV